MRYFFVLAAVMALSFGLMGPASVGAAAQSAGNTTVAPPTPAANETTDGQEIIAHDFERTLDRDVMIQSWRYDTAEREFTINVRIYNRTRLSITEALSLEEQGDAEINVFNSYLSPGDHRINFSADPGASGEASAILSTRRSFQQGRAVIISTGYVPDELPFAQTDSTTGWLGGFAVLLSMTVLAGIQRIRNARDEPRELL